MTRSQPSPQSYPTFWDAIPVDPPAPPPAAPADAYVVFADAAEGRPVKLWVEQADVG